MRQTRTITLFCGRNSPRVLAQEQLGPAELPELFGMLVLLSRGVVSQKLALLSAAIADPVSDKIGFGGFMAFVHAANNVSSPHAVLRRLRRLCCLRTRAAVAGVRICRQQRRLISSRKRTILRKSGGVSTYSVAHKTASLTASPRRSPQIKSALEQWSAASVMPHNPCIKYGLSSTMMVLIASGCG